MIMKARTDQKCVEIDDIFTVENRRETEDILAKLAVLVPWQIFLYSGVEHGFTIKGDLASERGRFAKKQAFKQAVEWLNEFVKQE
jgi:dienelactone hydrolase